PRYLQGHHYASAGISACDLARRHDLRRSYGAIRPGKEGTGKSASFAGIEHPGKVQEPDPNAFATESAARWAGGFRSHQRGRRKATSAQEGPTRSIRTKKEIKMNPRSWPLAILAAFFLLAATGCGGGSLASV